MAMSAEDRRQSMLSARSHNTYEMKRPPAERGPVITYENLKKAIRGSGGIKARVARRLEVTSVAITRALARPGWEELAERFQMESERIVDESEKTIMDLVKQRDDLPTALGAAKLVLQSKGVVRGWRKESLTMVEGAISVGHNVVNVDKLALPIEVRRRMLEAIEAQIPLPGAEDSVLDAEYQLMPPKVRVIEVDRITED